MNKLVEKIFRKKKRARCIFIAEERHGMEVFWYEHLQSGDPETDANYVKVFSREYGGEFLVMLHVSHIIPIPSAVGLIRMLGAWYPDRSFQKSIYQNWIAPSV